MRRWKAELRDAEGCLHDQHICVPWLVSFGSGGGACLEVAGMKQRRAVFQTGQVEHRGTGNVSRGKQFKFVAVE